MSRRDTALIVLAVVCVIVAGVLIWADKDAAAIAGAIGAATYPSSQRVKIGSALAWDALGDWSLVVQRLGSDAADTLATAIFLHGLVLRKAGT